MDIAKPGKVTVLVGGQWGSEGKGAVAGWLATQDGSRFHLAATNASAQSGHTTVMANGDKLVCRHLPTTAVMRHIPAYLTAGSVIAINGLKWEMDSLKFPKHLLLVHPMAVIITADDVTAEKEPDSSQAKIASTQKGVGAALARKVQRAAQTAGKDPRLVEVICDKDALVTALDRGSAGMLEVPQGFGLGLNHGGCYPHCTSRDCYVSSAMADAGLHPSYLHKTIMVVRTYPIRVGNIEGGYSGPPMPDHREVTFEGLGQPAEFTTVTRRPRRIFTFSLAQYRRALLYNRPDIVVVTFCNYLKTVGEFHWLYNGMRAAENELGLPHPRRFWQYGPTVENVTNSHAEIISVIEVRHG